jgi:hypothetical protein
MFLASSVCGLFKCRQFEPEVILLAVGWYSRFSLSYRDVEELLAERGLHADHRRCNVTPRKWNAVCARGSNRPTTLGVSTRRTSGSKASGCIYTGLSTPPVRRSTSFSRPSATPRRPNAFWPRPWAVQTIRRRWYQLGETAPSRKPEPTTREDQI